MESVPNKAEFLISIPPAERDRYYSYPYTGPYDGEPELYEIMHLLEYREIWGVNHLAISPHCPNCEGTNTEWLRKEWSICYDCLIAFDASDKVYDTQSYNKDERLDEELIKFIEED